MRPITILLSFILGATALSIGNPVRAQENGAPALTVAVEKPLERQWPETVPASGWLKPWHEAIIAAEVGDLRVTDVLIDVGSMVTKGQPLVRLSDEGARADLRKAQAALATAKVELAKASANAERARKVQGSGALSDEKISDYLIAEQTAEAGVESAEASLQSPQIKLDQTTIVAPDDGLITSRTAQLGAVVSPGTELFRLVRQRRVEWQAEISARYLPRVREGLTATIFSPSGRRVKGTVRLVGPTVSADTGRALAYVALPPEAHPPIGLYVTGQIELETSLALTVPESALVMRDGNAYIFTVDPDGRASRVGVSVGRRNGDEVEILSGLDRSADVVKAGGAFLSDKALVRVEAEAR